MSMRGKRWPRYFAIVVALVMIAETLAFTMTGYAKNDSNTVYELSDEDKTTVSEISNMTGVKADEIIRLRKEGKSWNEILELIKNNPGYKAGGDDIERNDTLVKTGMKTETIEELKKEGFTDKEIVEAKSITERMLFQLNEIVNMQSMAPSLPDTGVSIDTVKEADMASYTALTAKIDIDKAVYFILKLSSEFGNANAVLDEYLYSIQLEIDLELYMTDKEEYQRQKQQKAVELAAQEIITLSGIEEKMLEMLQKTNGKDEAVSEVKPITALLPAEEKEGIVPDIPVPEAEAVKPQNPAEAIRQELQSIQNNGTE